MAEDASSAKWGQVEDEQPEGSKRKKGQGLSFTKRVVLVALAVALITLLSSILVLSVV